MKIGIDCSCWSNRRGFGRFTRELVAAMADAAREDADVELVLYSDRQTAGLGTFPDGCRVCVAETSAAATEAASAEGSRSIGDMLKMRRLMKGDEPHVMFFPAVYSYFPLAGRVPCVVTLHDVIAETLPHLVFRTWKSKLFWNLKTRMALRRAACVLTVSEASKRGIAKHFGMAADRIRVIGEAPGSTFRAVDRERDLDVEALERHGIDPDGRFLLYVGGISPHKNLDTLIEAFADVCGSEGVGDVRLVLVGDYAGDSFHTCYEELTALVARREIGSAVHFAGFVPDDDLGHLYAGAEAFVFPSYLEGFGLPAAEAMACGAAVLASDRGSLPEVLGGAGVLFDPDDVGAMTGAMMDVLNDAPHRDDLRRRSLERVKTFSWERSARDTIDILREAAGVSGGAPVSTGATT